MMLNDSLVLEIENANSSQGEDVWMLNESQLSDFASAVIAANNAKVLADLKPVRDTVVRDGEPCFLVTSEIRASDQRVYPADTVSALIQRNAELEAKLAYYDADKAAQVP